MPRRRRGRDIHGILPLDKPLGQSSNAVLQHVRRLLDARKAGHTGSLDPLASGLLPLCFGEATKISGYLLDADKTYEFRCRLGHETATGDAEGEVTEQAPVPDLNETAVRAALSAFIGDIEQIPPMYSALKHEGQRLYRLARKGQEVARPPRRITISDYRLLALADGELSLRVTCSKGTYVRVLAEDLARALGSRGHVSALRRVAAGPYKASDMVDMATVEAAAEAGPEALAGLLQPLDTALAGWPRVTLTGDAAHYFKQGQPVTAPGAPPEGELSVYSDEEGLLGIGRVLPDGRVRARRLMIAA